MVEPTAPRHPDDLSKPYARRAAKIGHAFPFLRTDGARSPGRQPDDPASSPIGAFLAKPPDGTHALVWQVADEAAARAHFTGGLLQRRLSQGACVSGGLVIGPEDVFRGRHEFVPA